jgi:hypothetical protein
VNYYGYALIQYKLRERGELFVMRRLLCLFPVLLLLMGCIQYDEEMWLNRDGSGRAQMHITVNSNYQNTDTISKYANIDGIHLLNFKTYRNDDNSYYIIELKFDNLKAFNELNDQDAIAHFIGKSEIIKQKGGLLKFKRVISLGSTEIDDEDQMADLFQTIFTVNRNWRYTLHLPYSIVTANTDPSNIDYKNKTVKWNYEIAYLWNKDRIMEVTMDRKIPFFLFYIGLPALILLVLLILWRVSHHKKKKAILEENKA